MAALKVLKQRSSIHAFLYLFSHPLVYLGNIVSTVKIKQPSKVCLRDRIRFAFL